MAGLPITGLVGEAVVFDGSASTGDPLNGIVMRQTSTALSTTHVFTDPGVYQAVLTALAQKDTVY